MKKIFFFSLALFFTGLAMAQPPDATFKYSGEGVFYKIYRTGGNEAIPYGSYIEYTLEQFYNDSLLVDTKSRKMIMGVDSTVVPMAYFQPLKNVNVGDSIIYSLATDSSMDMYSSLPWVKKGNFFNTRFKIEKLFADRAEADAALIKNQREDSIEDAKRDAAQIMIESAKIEDYFAARDIKFIKTPSGIYISYIKIGPGANPTKASTVLVNYTGKTLDGRVFDSNTDPAFQHVQPYEVNLTTSLVIKGWKEGLLYFPAGTIGELYIPSPLGYGTTGNGSAIAPNETLIFDIEVIKVSGGTKPRAVVKKPVKKIKTATKKTTKHK